MNTEQVLARLPAIYSGGPGEMPASLGQLPGSTSGRAFVLQRGNQRWLLRYDRSSGAGERLAREFRVLQALQASGIAPTPLWLDADLGLMVCEYVQGMPWDEAAIASPQRLDDLARLIAIVHRHQLAAEPMAPLPTLEAYLRGERTALATSLLHRCRQAMGQISGGHQALCHHDLWRGNILQAGRTRLIDWEYAGSGDPLFDLATVICYHGLSPDQAEALWLAYRDETGTGRQRVELDLWCVVVDTLTLGWAMARASDPASLASARPFALRAARRLGLNWPVQQA
jgi:aminoglycoside phosphotransferase (APT) family kinase protein